MQWEGSGRGSRSCGRELLIVFEYPFLEHYAHHHLIERPRDVETLTLFATEAAELL